jgi:hypothetical protein
MAVSVGCLAGCRLSGTLGSIPADRYRLPHLQSEKPKMNAVLDPTETVTTTEAPIVAMSDVTRNFKFGLLTDEVQPGQSDFIVGDRDFAVSSLPLPPASMVNDLRIDNAIHASSAAPLAWTAQKMVELPIRLNTALSVINRAPRLAEPGKQEQRVPHQLAAARGMGAVLKTLGEVERALRQHGKGPVCGSGSEPRRLGEGLARLRTTQPPVFDATRRAGSNHSEPIRR